MRIQLGNVFTNLATMLVAGFTAEAQYLYTTLDDPVHTGRPIPSSISGTNIVGYYDASVPFGYTPKLCDGFLYNGNSYMTIDVPGVRAYNSPQGISGANIVGWYSFTLGSHGFFYDGSTWVTLDDPLADQFIYDYAGTSICGISGTNAVGDYLDTNGVNHGFLYNGTTWITLDEPLSASGFDQGTFAKGIWESKIVGYYTDTNDVNHGFLYNGSAWITLDHPLATGTFAQGISGTNIVGYYTDTNEVNHGFLYNGSTWTTLDNPLAGTNDVYGWFGFLQGTVLNGISGNTLVGSFVDQWNLDHGFVATPLPQLTIVASGQNVVLSWPVNATAFTLQSTTDLSSPSNWTNIFTTPFVINGLNTVTNPISGSRQFYRLTH